MLVAIMAFDIPDSQTKRAELRPAHLAHLQRLSDAGRLKLAGPFTDGTGSLIVVECESLEAARKLAEEDPYTQGQLFERVDVKPFKQVFPSP
jgi:uncharacterized protein YciI